MKFALPKPLRRIGWRIFAPFTVLLVSVALLFSAIGLQYAQGMIRSNAKNELSILSIVLSQLVAGQLMRVEQSLKSMESHGLLVSELKKPTPDRAVIEDFLDKRLAMLPLFEDFAVFNRNGECVGATDPTWYEIVAKKQPFFVKGLMAFNVSEIFTADESKVQLVSTPITNDTVTKGVIVGQVNMSSIYDLMDQKLGLSETSDAFLLDSSLRFITPGKTGTDRLLESHLRSTNLLKHLKSGDFWVDQYKNFTGQEVLGTARPVPGRHWFVVVERDLDEVTKPVNDAKKVIVLATLGLVLVLVGVTYVLTRSITKPLMALVDGAQRVAEGDFSSPFPTPKGIDEVAFLATEFDKMRARVAAFQEHMVQRLEESERKRLENERLAAIGTLASTLAHEIRNPLNAMSLLLARLELARTESSVRAGVIRDLRGEIGRLDRLVSDILDYARPLHLQLVISDLRDLLTSTVELYRGLAEGQGIEVISRFADQPLALPFDLDKIKQCLVNIFQNAVDAIPAGGGRIEIDANVEDGLIQVVVRDSGIGLPPQPQGRLFDLFFTTKEKGTGLGLSTVKKIVDAHGGQITLGARTDLLADGTPPRGAEVRLVFPFFSQN